MAAAGDRERGRSDLRSRGRKRLSCRRTRAKLDSVAKDIKAAGGSVDVAELDALDDRAVDAHVKNVVSKTGRVDISFNLIARGDAKGHPAGRYGDGRPAARRGQRAAKPTSSPPAPRRVT